MLFVSAFVGMQLVIVAIQNSEIRDSSSFVILSTAVTVGLIGGALKELEIGLLVRQQRIG